MSGFLSLAALSCFEGCFVYRPSFFARAINAPSTGNTYDAWLAAAKALGSNEKPVRYSLVSSAPRALIILSQRFADF